MNSLPIASAPPLALSPFAVGGNAQASLGINTSAAFSTPEIPSGVPENFANFAVDNPELIQALRKFSEISAGSTQNLPSFNETFSPTPTSLISQSAPINSINTLSNPLNAASSVTVGTGATTNLSTSVGAGTKLFDIKSAPNPFGPKVSPIIDVRNISSLSTAGVAIKQGVIKTIGQAAANAGIPVALPPLDKALKTLGVEVKNLVKVNLADLGIKFPKFPGFPGLDLIGINLGAGAKWIAETLLKYKIIVPPWIAGLKINMGIALAAIAVIKAAIETSPSAVLKHLLSTIVSDIKDQALSQLQTAINEAGSDIKSQISGAIDGAKQASKSSFERANPPKTEVDPETGETRTLTPQYQEPTDLIAASNALSTGWDYSEDDVFNEFIAEKSDSTQGTPISGVGAISFNNSTGTSNVQVSSDSTTSIASSLNPLQGSTLKSFTFPPNG